MVQIERILSTPDACRAAETFQTLARHGVSTWALTGGLAFEIHWLRLGRQRAERVLNDIDFIAAAFGCIPEKLGDDFLFRHIHAATAPGRMILQFADPKTALRIDVFRANGAVLDRASSFGPFQLVCLEDLVARAARVVLDIGDGVYVHSKHACDFLRFVELVDGKKMNLVWQDHRKATHPYTWEEARGVLALLIPVRRHLLITSTYSNDTGAVCPRCTPTDVFPLADPNVISALLGYC